MLLSLPRSSHWQSLETQCKLFQSCLVLKKYKALLLCLVFGGTYHNEDPLTTEETYHMLTAKLLRNKGTDVFETTRQAYLVAFEGLHQLDQHLRSLTERHG